MNSYQFNLEIGSSNSAFEDSPEIEIARILRNVADRIESGSTNGTCRDFNGNSVGEFTYYVDDE